MKKLLRQITNENLKDHLGYSYDSNGAAVGMNTDRDYEPHDTRSEAMARSSTRRSYFCCENIEAAEQ